MTAARENWALRERLFFNFGYLVAERRRAIGSDQFRSYIYGKFVMLKFLMTELTPTKADGAEIARGIVANRVVSETCSRLK